MDGKIKQLKKMVDGSDNIVFFGGAGVSTESGLPDFRSPGGIYDQEKVWTNGCTSTEILPIVPHIS